MSIETGMPEVPRYAMYSGWVLDQINWQMQRSGLLTATARLVAQGETVGTTTSAGTPAALELQRLGHFNGAIPRNGSALGNVVSADITYANNLDRIETIRSDGRIDGADPSIAALTGSIEVRFRHAGRRWSARRADLRRSASAARPRKPLARAARRLRSRGRRPGSRRASRGRRR